MIIVIDLLSDIDGNFLSIVCLFGFVCVAKSTGEAQDVSLRTN